MSQVLDGLFVIGLISSAIWFIQAFAGYAARRSGLDIEPLIDQTPEQTLALVEDLIELENPAPAAQIEAIDAGFIQELLQIRSEQSRQLWEGLPIRILQGYAKLYSIKGYSRMRSVELIQALQTA